MTTNSPSMIELKKGQNHGTYTSKKKKYVTHNTQQLYDTRNTFLRGLLIFFRGGVGLLAIVGNNSCLLKSW